MTITKKDLTEALDEVLNKKRAIDDSTHRAHHKFIEMEIQRREDRKELFKRFKMTFVGGIALGILGFLGWIGSLIIDYLQRGNHP